MATVRTKRLTIDWQRAPHVSTHIIWEANVYEYYRTERNAIHPIWRCTPFDPDRMGSMPAQSGIYAIIYKHRCIGFPEQEIVMYVGQSNDLKERFREYSQIAKQAASTGIDQPPHKDRTSRLKFLFGTFERLLVRYIITGASKEERESRESELIKLLDPPFNWKERARPRDAPTIGRPSGTLQVKAGKAQPIYQT